MQTVLDATTTPDSCKEWVSCLAAGAADRHPAALQCLQTVLKVISHTPDHTTAALIDSSHKSFSYLAVHANGAESSNP
jgi:hypothetical protein